ncbi:nucleoside phosphatase family-domain-containing protein [Mycena galopus ATCC 62051]|nr:nucleoside phosphatase family-domain-containing protein [Mycena galopus ATCC 62051]
MKMRRRVHGGCGRFGFGFGWALGAGALFLLVCVFVQREQCASLDGLGRLPGNTLYEPATGTEKLPVPPSSAQEDPPPPSGPGYHGQDAVDLPPKRPSAAHPTSFDSDLNPAFTTHCTSSFSPSSPIVQYAVVIEAGPTSRIHIYKFNNCARLPAYEWEVRQTRGGFASFAGAGRPAKAADSLRPLLDEAVRVVPKGLVRCTRVAVRVTVGLRVWKDKEADAILGAVRALFVKGGEYPFMLQEGEEGVGIMDGAEQGMFAWVTANYLLGALSPSSSSGSLASSSSKEEHDQTYAVLALGGGSTQIVFAPSLSSSLASPAAPAPSMLPGEHRYELDIAGTTRILYRHSYLGWGLVTARGRVHRIVGTLAAPQDDKMRVETEDEVIPNPCLAKGMERVVEILSSPSLGGGYGLRKVTMTGASIGSFDACRDIVELALKKDAPCPVGPCSFGGVYQPAIGEVFPEVTGEGRGRVLLQGYFYDRVNPLLHPAAGSGLPGQNKGAGERGQGGKEELIATVDTFAELAKTVCAGREAWLERWGTHVGVMQELEGRPEWCLDLVWMWGLLKIGYEFTGDREVMFGAEIAGAGFGWSLGAGIKLVSGGGVQCPEI